MFADNLLPAWEQEEEDETNGEESPGSMSARYDPDGCSNAAK